MPFLLMVFLVLVCVPEAEAWGQLQPQWTDSPWWCVAATWLAVALTGVHASVVAWRLRRAPQSDPALRERALQRYERGRFRHQVGVFVVYILALIVLGWGWSVGRLWMWDARTPLPGAELLLLMPFLVAQVLGWSAYYDAERASYQASLLLSPVEPQGATWLELERPPRGAPPMFGSRGSYVLFQVRQKLALVLLPVALLLIQREIVRWSPSAWQEWQGTVNGAGIVAVLAVFVAMPWIVRLVLGLKPLPACVLRDRLEVSAKRLTVGYSNILLWNTRNGMANAFVIGIVPWVRYVVFTDRLVEDFTPEEIEAVFGHEVGHVRHRHMLYYLVFLAASVIALGGLGELAAKSWGFAPELTSAKPLVYLPMIAVLLGYIFIVFGFLSRRCERQADVFGCRAVSCGRADCRGHDSNVDPGQRGRELCATGIRTFIRALEKVAIVNGISRDRPGFLQSWQHSTIAQRVEFLQLMVIDPSVEPRFQRRVALVKWGLFIVLGGAVTMTVFLVRSWGL